MRVIEVYLDYFDNPVVITDVFRYYTLGSFLEIFTENNAYHYQFQLSKVSYFVSKDL